MSCATLVRRWLPALAALLVVVPPPSSLAAQPGPQGRREALNAPENPLLQGFRWRSIGPVGQGGRVDDIEVRPDDPKTFYVAFATAGIWKTTNNGTTFRPVFDEYGTHSFGDLAIAPSDPDIIYAGTGEANNRQSSSMGEGIYKSTDGGETWTYVGLRETETISRVHVHPTNPDIVWVAANGKLFGPNPERGVFKTTDGGRSWNHVLAVDENTGATDLVVNPADPNVLLAATYQRRRTTCCFVGGGPGSGMWRSEDGGETWTRLEGNGLPRGTMGRVALAVTPADPDVVYAQIEVAPTKEEPLSEEEQEAWQERRRSDDFADDQSSGVWRSDDGGRSWEFRSNENGRPMYFSQIRVSPQDPDLVYTVDQNVAKSRDGARTWDGVRGYGHVDQHAFWIDPADHDHLIIGNDGSVDVSWDQGESWESIRTWAVGQPYHASVDMRRPYYVCTGLQDNGSWCGPSSTRSGGILAQDWYRVGGGDGFYTAIDPTDPSIVYSESQNGNIRRMNLRTGESGSIRPSPPSQRNPRTNIVPAPEPGTQVRWNWNTPFVLSPHNPSIVHAGANRLFTSRDRGETWTMSADLTKNIDRSDRVVMGMSMDTPSCNPLRRGEECIPSRNDGVGTWGTIVSVGESSIVPGVLWVGTDDGNIQVSRDGGATWTEVSRNLPGGTTEHYVSRVEPSHFDAATAYVSIDAHREGDLRPYVYVTRDHGQTWTSISSNLPGFGNVNTVRQDPNNENLLYAGTEFGFFVSVDEGASWHRFMPDLPVVRVDDVLVHPRDNDLVLATHGRSVMILDDVTPLQQMTPEVLASNAHLFEPRDAVMWRGDIRQSRSVTGDKNWVGQGAPDGAFLSFYLGGTPPGDVTLQVVDLGDRVIRDLEIEPQQGLNRVRWDLRANPEGENQRSGPQVDPGMYGVRLTVAGQAYTTTLRVVEDVWMDPL